MIYADSKELYLDFLLSDFWINLSRRKRELVPTCEKCGSSDALQAHHIRYTPNLFDVKMDDLVVLCRKCHEKEHGIVSEPTQTSAVQQSVKEQLWHLYNHPPQTIFPKKPKHKKHKKHRRRFNPNRPRKPVRTGNFLVAFDGRIVYQPRF